MARRSNAARARRGPAMPTSSGVGVLPSSEVEQGPVPHVSDRVTTGNLPATPGRPGRPGTTVTVRADPRAEYASAGGWAFWANYAKSLPWAIDDVAADLGPDIYLEMLKDAQVNKVIRVLKTAILEEGVECAPSITDEDHPDYLAAKRVAEWSTAALEQMSTPLDVVLFDLLDCLALGNRVAEIVWHLAPDTEGRQCLLPRVLHPKPRPSTSFVTNATMDVLGLLVLLPGQTTVVQPNMLLADLSQVPNFLPRDKFLVLTHAPINGDPRGTSLLRPAYDSWWLKRQLKQEWLKFAAQVASPSVVGFTPPDAQPITEGPDGTPLTSLIMPEQDMATQLATLRNGTALAFPNGADVKWLEVKTAGEPFQMFIDFCNREIVNAVLLQALATEEGRHQTRAASGTHENVQDTAIRQLKRFVAWTIRNDLLRLMVLYNFGPKLLPLVPRVLLGHVEEHDFATTATGIAALQQSGFIGASQRPGIDEMLGLPRRDEEADARAATEALAAAQAIAVADPADTAPQRTESKQLAGGQVAADQAEGATEQGKTPPALTTKVPPAGRG